MELRERIAEILDHLEDGFITKEEAINKLAAALLEQK